MGIIHTFTHSYKGWVTDSPWLLPEGLKDTSINGSLTYEGPKVAKYLGRRQPGYPYLLSARLHSLVESTPRLVPSEATSSKAEKTLRVLELGSGTGLVGLAFVSDTTAVSMIVSVKLE
ncbi:hypothetical protein AWENTII_001712 [Aspergillus wentii]